MCQGADRVKKTRVQTLKAEFESLRMDDNEQLDEFYMKLNGLVSTIRALGEEAHEERLNGQKEVVGGKLLLTEEELFKREKNEGRLLLTREEWLKRTNKDNTEGQTSVKGRGGRDKSRVKCYNCILLGHYAAECRRPRRAREQKHEANIAEMEDEEPALLLANYVKEEDNLMLLNEHKITPKLVKEGGEKKTLESNLWYLDNGASNHMTGQKSKFKELDESITGQVRFGDGSTVKIEGKGNVNFK
ncbi:hypothetical protein AgCh_020395 [Apium graveolens]